MVVNPRKETDPFAHVMAAMDVVHLSPAGKEQMFGVDHRFGIDWNNDTDLSPDALDEDDWQVSRNHMQELERDGGLVYLPLTNTPVKGGLIGQVEPETSTEVIEYEAGSETSREKVKMKTLQLTGVRQALPDDNHDLAERVNTGRYTVHHLDTHRDKVLDAYEDYY